MSNPSQRFRPDQPATVTYIEQNKSGGEVALFYHSQRQQHPQAYSDEHSFACLDLHSQLTLLHGTTICLLLDLSVGRQGTSGASRPAAKCIPAFVRSSQFGSSRCKRRVSTLTQSKASPSYASCTMSGMALAVMSQFLKASCPKGLYGCPNRKDR